jgi:hypothetical protein
LPARRYYRELDIAEFLPEALVRGRLAPEVPYRGGVSTRYSDPRLILEGGGHPIWKNR